MHRLEILADQAYEINPGTDRYSVTIHAVPFKAILPGLMELAVFETHYFLTQ